MIISRTPLRITLAGGGTDIPEFYTKYGGSVTSMSIDKYIYISFKRNILDDLVRLRYLQTEEVTNSNKLSNERARCVLQKFKIHTKCEITSIGDLPSNTGLGSSGSYLVGMINTLQAFLKLDMNKQDIAELACDLEINTLGEPVGKQDQYAASYGGITTFSINKNGIVSANSVSVKNLDTLIENSRVYYIGNHRNASDILLSQKNSSKTFDKNLLKISELSQSIMEALRNSDYDSYGKLLNEHWYYKKQLSNQISLKHIDELYQILIEKNLILGGKIIGAGGGGFLLLYVPEQHSVVDDVMSSNGYPRLEYTVDNYGSKIIYE